MSELRKISKYYFLIVLDEFLSERFFTKQANIGTFIDKANKKSSIYGFLKGKYEGKNEATTLKNSKITFLMIAVTRIVTRNAKARISSIERLID